MNNLSLLRKADIAIGNLQADGGELAPEEGTSFIRKLIKSPTLLAQARVVGMTASSRKINKIGFGSRILRKAQSATALTQNQRSKPTTDQIELNTKEQIAEVRLPYDALEDNIEHAEAANNEASNTGPGGLRQTLIDLIAERAALDLEELALLGDTAYVSGDPDDQAYMSQLDGFLKLASTEGHSVDADGASVTKTLFKKGLKAMPDQFQRRRTEMKHFVSVDNEVEYRDTLADRGTGMGDQYTTGDLQARAYGSAVEAVHLMPDDEGLFTHPKNLIVGIQRRVSMEFDKDITQRVYIIVLTVRVAYAIEETDAIVYYENIGEADD